MTLTLMTASRSSASPARQPLVKRLSPQLCPSCIGLGSRHVNLNVDNINQFVTLDCHQCDGYGLAICDCYLRDVTPHDPRCPCSPWHRDRYQVDFFPHAAFPKVDVQPDPNRLSWLPAWQQEVVKQTTTCSRSFTVTNY